jgi:hypothetical protein
MYQEVMRTADGAEAPAGHLDSGLLYTDCAMSKAEKDRALDAMDAAAAAAASSGTEPRPDANAASASDDRAAYYDVSFDWIKMESVRVGATTVYPYVCRVVSWMDWLGGKVASGTGLTSSRFQYAVDEYYRRERKRERREKEEEAILLQRARDRGLLRKTRDDDDEDEDDVPYAPPLVTHRVAAPQHSPAPTPALEETHQPSTDV